MLQGNARSIVNCDDGSGHVVHGQALNIIDFPRAKIRLYFYAETILLPGEHQFLLQHNAPIQLRAFVPKVAIPQKKPTYKQSSSGQTISLSSLVFGASRPVTAPPEL
jgi:hypothetical protein